MATIITKFSSTASATPLASDLVQGELAVNTSDKRLLQKITAQQLLKLALTHP